MSSTSSSSTSVSSAIQSPNRGTPSPTPNVAASPLENIIDSSNAERKARFRLYREGETLFVTEYKDKDDLYQSLMKKLDDLKISRQHIYIVDDSGKCIEISDADTLFRMAEKNYAMKLNVRATDDQAYLSPDSPKLKRKSIEQRVRTDEDESCTRPECCGHRCVKHHSRNRSHSNDRFSYECPLYVPQFFNRPPHGFHFCERLTYSYSAHPPPFFTYGCPPPFYTIMPFCFNPNSQMQYNSSC